MDRTKSYKIELSGIENSARLAEAECAVSGLPVYSDLRLADFYENARLHSKHRVSGSTLLESLLGTNPNWFNVGEAYKIRWWPRCACGSPLDDCPFWNEVAEKLKHGDSGELQLRDFHISGRRKSRRLPTLHDAFVMAGTPRTLPFFSLSKEVRAFQDGCRKALALYEAVSDVAGSQIIIDSSKDPVLLKHLYCLTPQRFRVIHLVRDARAVSWSHVNNFKRDGATYPTEESEQCPTLAESAVFWKRRNLNLKMATRSFPSDQKLVLRYEDLCQTPEECGRQISELVGERVSLPKSFRPKAQHSISGNPMRRIDRDIEVDFKEDWRQRLAPEEIAEIELISGKLNREYGYE